MFGSFAFAIARPQCLYENRISTSIDYEWQKKERKPMLSTGAMQKSWWVPFFR